MLVAAAADDGVNDDDGRNGICIITELSSGLAMSELPSTFFPGYSFCSL